MATQSGSAGAHIEPGHAETENVALLRELLVAYDDGFRRVPSRGGGALRSLTRRLMGGHARASVTELERLLHSRSAIDGESEERQQMLRDLEHYRMSLATPLSALTRTIIVAGIALLAQLLGRLPLVPIVTGPERKPALGSLNEAIDVDPGHIAKAISDLLGSPMITICGAVATL